MNPLKIDMGSYSRFLISVGLLFLILAGIIFYQIIPEGNEKTIVLFTLGVFALIVSPILIIIGEIKWQNEEKFLKQYKQEFMVNQILKQDLNFQELNIKNVEYNTKAQDYNKKYKNPIYKTVICRDFESIGRQIANPNWYKDHYGPKKNKR